MNKIITKEIGIVGVDSGQILICDPCYIDSEWKKTKNDDDIFNKKFDGEFSYAGCCQATLKDKEGDEGGQLNFALGHAGAGVAMTSGFGDGGYPVIAKIKNYGTDEEPDWRVKEAVIKFIAD